MNKKTRRFVFNLPGNPCLNGSPCMNSGTCFGQYSINGSVYTQCFCLQGYTGTFCEGNRIATNIVMGSSFFLP